MVPASHKEKPLSGRRGLELRAATSADAPGLCDLLCGAGLGVAPADLADRLDAIRDSPGAVLITADWGPPNGVVALHWFATLRSARPTAHIDALLVRPDDRRRGIGRLLVKAASQAARAAGCGAIEMTAGAEAEGLHAFCLATGFIEAGTHLTRALRMAAP
jgi:aminoglycoside 6'-N-acetyltransferase I